jgi:hypothetical protein
MSVRTTFSVDAFGMCGSRVTDVVSCLRRRMAFVSLPPVESVHVRKKIDRTILPILMWVYFLQILDKTVVGYAAIFGMRTDAKLVGNQYSLIGSSGYWAQRESRRSWWSHFIRRELELPILILPSSCSLSQLGRSLL